VADDDAPISPRKPGKPRADAQRNRLLLLETAKTAFAEKGSGASLDEIARAAEVGIGTLYRHFPTRDALIAAVYRNETEQLAQAATLLASQHPPVQALRAWMRLFVDYLAAKKGISEALNSIVGGPSDPYAASSDQIKRAIAMLVDHATASGEFSLDLDPLDLLRALAGIVTLSAGPHWKQSAERLIDIMLAGMQTQQRAP
jgi:AcrR family transcriptional regulator